MKVYVTGANGFVGKALCNRLISEKILVFGAVRGGNASQVSPGVTTVEIGDIDNETNWGRALSECDFVVHTAARVHMINDKASGSLAAYRTVNVQGTEHLARESAKLGAKRFVFISTIKVNGEESLVPYRETDKPGPSHLYGISKMEAEIKLRAVASETGLEVVILRPPLIYGPGVKANFLKLIETVDRGLPLPFASINNQRSLLYIENLVDAIVLCLRYPKAAGQTFLLSDGENLSTPNLIRRIAAALGRSPRLIHVPPQILYHLARVVGKIQAADHLIGSLTADDTKIRHDLGWRSPFTIDHGIEKTIAWYKNVYKPRRENREPGQKK